MLLLGSGEAARRLRIHPLTLHRWHATGKLIPLVVDSERRRLYSEAQIAEFITQREAGASRNNRKGNSVRHSHQTNENGGN